MRGAQSRQTRVGAWVGAWLAAERVFASPPPISTASRQHVPIADDDEGRGDDATAPSAHDDLAQKNRVPVLSPGLKLG